MLMDKKLRNYIEYIKKEAKHPTPELIEYHKVMTQQFQHERLIHLIVTMFFALFLVLMFALFLGLALAVPAETVAANIMLASTGGITLILLITTLFYVRHYYLLENGTQELEEITRKLYKRV